MMCRDVADLTTEAAEGALTGGKLWAYRAHLLLCPFCRAHKRQVDATVSTLRAMPKEAPAEEARERALAVFRSRKGSL